MNKGIIHLLALKYERSAPIAGLQQEVDQRRKAEENLRRQKVQVEEIVAQRTSQLKNNEDSSELSDVTGDGEFILVSDNIPAQREIATGILDRLGYRSQAVVSGEEAIGFVRQHTVDLIILDMIMEPVMKSKQWGRI